MTDALPFLDEEKVEISREVWEEVAPTLNVIIVDAPSTMPLREEKCMLRIVSWNRVSTAAA